ncbi:MAG: AAA family ATPase [Paracoccaceae bacterium]|nr:AAA family ATPase [Paracoccaceae bacterium]
MLRRVLVTGCSGAGKSALVAEMAGRGYEVRREPGRRVIRAETRTGGRGLPWEDAERFARLCLKLAIADWEEARAGTVIFDRGVLEAALALERLGFVAEAAAALDAYGYDAPVILAPPWPELFRADTERRQGAAEAEAEFAGIEACLNRTGLAAAHLPRDSVAARADWLEARLGAG